MTPRHAFIALAITFNAFGGFALAATGRERHDAVYPPQKLPLSFSHAQHFEEGVECVGCHDPARKSLKAADRLLPGHPECESCHDIEEAAAGKEVDPPSACNTCHVGYDPTVHKEVAKVILPTANLLFSHRAHYDKKIECTTCHFSANSSSMEDVGLSTRYQLPKMETCLNCHNGQSASADCKTCHLTDPSGRLQLSFASGVLKPSQGDPFGLDHGPRYEFTHGTRAKLDKKACVECHTESSCMSCHDSLQKPLSVHPNDFISLHPVSARLDAMQCDGCHRYQSFCAACHERSGVGQNSDPSLRARNMRVHPDYATWVLAPGPLHHSVAASRDIKQCISCHREESCMTCHANGELVGRQGLGTNPHPQGFAAQCKSLAARNDRACLKCHTEATLQAKGCR